MALLKDLIVQGASRFIGDAYFATIKAGVWNGTPIDLSHGGTALTSGTQTAGKILKSTATNGVSEWVAQSTLSVGSATNATNATYAANVGTSGTAGTNYVTAATVIATCNWYSTMNAASDADALINRWVEVRDFLNNFTEADTLASILSTYVTLGTAQTITGAKTFANPISGDLLGNATTADRLKSTTAVGGAGTPVYFTGGLPVACTAANVRTFLGLGTVYSHAHTDYVTNVSYSSGKLLQSKGGGTASDIVNLDNYYLPLAGGTMTGQIRRDYSTANTLPMIYALAANNDVNIIRVSFSETTAGTAQLSANYGFTLRYHGTGDGNDNSLQILADALAGTQVTAISIQLDGTTTFNTTPKVGTNLVVTAGNYTDYVNSTNFPVLGYTLSGVNGRTVSSSTAGYCAYYSAASTVSGTSLLQFNTTNSTITSSGTIISATAAFGTLLHIWRKNDADHSVIGFYKGTSTKTLIGYIGLAGTTTTSATNGTPIWSADSTNWYQLAYSTGATAVGGTGTPVYVDANGQLQACTAYSSASVSYAASSGQVRTQSRSTDAAHYLTFVDSNNSSATAETVYTDAGITYNPSTNLLTVEKLTASGVVNLSGSTTIDSLTAGSLIVTGASSLTGNVSMGTVTAGTWNGSVIDVAHGGTGCSTLTSGSALIGNGTGAVTFRSIDNTTTVGSLMNVTTWALSTNLVTRNAIAYWDGRYQTTSNASNLAYCIKGAFGDAATRTYATAISTASGTTSATVNNYNSDSYVPTNNAVYNFVTSTLGVSTTITKTEITKSLNSSTWTETGYTLYGESQGSYMLQITDSTTSTVFTGVFSIYHRDSAPSAGQGNALDEIPLHMCSNTNNIARIYAATQDGKLLVSSQDANATSHRLTIKYKKII